MMTMRRARMKSKTFANISNNRSHCHTGIIIFIVKVSVNIPYSKQVMPTFLFSTQSLIC